MKLSKNIKLNFALYTMVLPGVALIFVFSYLPIYGIVMAFQNFNPTLGFFDSPFVGLAHFQRILADSWFRVAFRNTVVLGVLNLIIGFPAPILFALLLNEIRNRKYKRVAQTISYMPFFLSSVIIVGMMRDLLGLNGAVNLLIDFFGFERINFFLRADMFRELFVGSGIWMNVGFGSIIYLAAIAGINPELYESAVIDGGNRFQQAVYITIPSILPTVTILFIFAVGRILSTDFQRILLMYNPAIYSTSDVVGTYMFRMGIEGASQSYAAAVGLSMSLISVVFLTITNYVCKYLGETSLW